MNRRLAQFSIKIQGRRGQGGVFKIERLKRHEVNSQVPTVEAAA
jgi:hypothetical protein